MNWMIQHDMFYKPQLKIVFHDEKKDKTIITTLYEFP